MAINQLAQLITWYDFSGSRHPRTKWQNLLPIFEFCMIVQDQSKSKNDIFLNPKSVEKTNKLKVLVTIEPIGKIDNIYSVGNQRLI